MESSYKRKCFQQRGGAASWPLPHTQNGIYKMPTKARLQKLLTEMASQDQSYSGLDDDSEPEPITMDNLSLGETGPTSFSPLRGTPNSQPPSLYSYRFYSYRNSIFSYGVCFATFFLCFCKSLRMLKNKCLVTEKVCIEKH